MREPNFMKRVMEEYKKWITDNKDEKGPEKAPEKAEDSKPKEEAKKPSEDFDPESLVDDIANKSRRFAESLGLSKEVEQVASGILLDLTEWDEEGDRHVLQTKDLMQEGVQELLKEGRAKEERVTRDVTQKRQKYMMPQLLRLRLRNHMLDSLITRIKGM